MAKFYSLLLIFFLSIGSVQAQTYGNEWINYNQQYYKFPISTSGFQKITVDAMVLAGIPVASFSSENLQVFGREKEVAIWIEDGGDNVLDAGDYIIFYAAANDGWIDKELYATPDEQGNPYHNLYNKKIFYFLSWNTSNSNLRAVQEIDTNFTSYSSSNYIVRKNHVTFENHYNEGYRIDNVSSSLYTIGEGFGQQPISSNNEYNISVAQLYTGSAPLPHFRSMISGANNFNNNGNPNHHVRINNFTSGNLVDEKIFLGYEAMFTDKDIPISQLVSGTNKFTVESIYDLNVAPNYDSWSLNYMELRYPALPDALGNNSDKFKLPNSTQSKVKLELSNVSGSNHWIFIMDENGAKRVSFTNIGASSVFVVSNSSSSSEQTVYFQPMGSESNITDITTVSTSGFFHNILAGNIEGALIMVYPNKFQQSILPYVNYRQSINGGGYNVVRAESEQIALQFAGGVPHHAIGIRRLAQYFIDNTTDKPKGLFFVGKGINSLSVRATTSYENQNLIPAFGVPNSDISYSMQHNGSGWVPMIPTGRIAVKDSIQLQNYLDKLILYDQQQNQSDVYTSATKDWQKQILHFAGGPDLGQQTLFQTYMNAYENTIEGSQFAGNVHRFYKSSSLPFDPYIVDTVTARISEGVSLMNFFGHSLPGNSGFEINIDNPINWNNYGKYPLVIGNSCYNGNCFTPNSSTSENFVQIKDFGAIGFISTVYLGIPHSLNNYTAELYRQFSSSSYGATLGEQMRKTVENLYNNSNLDIYNQTTSEQMVLNGDPMIRVNYHNNPEIEITNQSYTISPQDIDLSTDSIILNLDIKNLGRSIDSNYTVEIVRDFPNSNDDSTYLFVRSGLNYSDQLTVSFPLQPNIGIGQNLFKIRIDQPSFYTEQYDEFNNNTLEFALQIRIDGILPVLPSKFAVVPLDSVSLYASTIDPLADFNNYRFEIDTTDYFNSPFKKYAMVSGLGGVKQVDPSSWLSVSNNLPSPLVLTDSTVYFWRVAVDDGLENYVMRSFQYISGKEGWGQDHFFQSRENGYFGINYNEPDRIKEFSPIISTLESHVYGGYDGYVSNVMAYYLNGQSEEYGICFWTPSIHVAVIDPVTMRPWGTKYGTLNTDHSFGNVNDNGGCRQRVEDYFIFRQNSASQLAAFQNMVLNEVPDGHYLLVYSAVEPQYQAWDTLAPSMYNTFQTLGSDSIVPGISNRGFSFFCKKGEPTTVVEKFLNLPAPDAINGLSEAQDSILLKATMYSDELGLETSPLIGPASSWNSIYWKQNSLDGLSGDSTTLRINLYDQNKNLISYIDTNFTLQDSINDLSNIVDANTYPFISLEAKYLDIVNYTPAQVDYWHVLYTPLPEAAIDGTNGFYWSKINDSINEGEEVSFAIDIKNIYKYDMDSLLVNYWVEDANHNRQFITYPRQEKLLVGDILKDTISFSTLGMGGYNIFWMEVNPYLNGSFIITDQPEQEHFNNLLQIPFFVNADDVNPILDVTFDGQHILNGDIVSPQTEIVISLKDDNEFLIMDNVSDTTLFGVYIIDPAGNQKKINFQNNGEVNMQWIPANGQNKKFKIIWPTEFKSDGIYTLLVQATDRSGNLSGDIQYKVNFEIINESSITYLMNYPNPFSTSTKFVFTLTGNDMPEDIIIQIMTVSGRIVREITEDEIGPLQIGRNITQFAWDGTDEFGDRLANGVYLYTVKAKINGESIKHRDSGADQYFKKEFGKMYLMR